MIWYERRMFGRMFWMIWYGRRMFSSTESVFKTAVNPLRHSNHQVLRNISPSFEAKGIQN
jgi:hypothetical protein